MCYWRGGGGWMVLPIGNDVALRQPCRLSRYSTEPVNSYSISLNKTCFTEAKNIIYWRMDRWWMTDGQAKSKKMMYFQHFSKTIRYFFLVVSLPLRRVFKTFSEKNSKKIKNFKFFKKFRTTFFFQGFFRFFFKKSEFLKKYLIFFSSCFASP